MQRHILQNPRNISIFQNDGKSTRTIFQIIQRLGIGLHSIGMIHPLQDGPWRMIFPVRPRALNLLIQRFNANAIRRLAHQLFSAFTFQDCGHAGLPHLHRRFRKIIHPAMLVRNSALSIGP